MGEFGIGPGLSAVAVFFLCLAAKMVISFAFRVPKKDDSYELVGEEKDKFENASKAQLNVAEYDGPFLALLLFFHIQKSDGMLVTIVSITLPLAQAIYFFGRVLSGSAMPWAPLGALPRYICMGIMIYLLYSIVVSDGMLGPGPTAVCILFLSLAAKLYMSFCVRSSGDSSEKAVNAGKAQLNTAEYDGPFLALLLFFHIQKIDGLLVAIVSITLPLAQAIYFWGRALTGGVTPWAPLGGLPRYACMGIMIYLLYTIVVADGMEVGPGTSAVCILFFSLAAKLYMSFCVRVSGDSSEKAVNAGKAQLNTAEYDGPFLALLLFFHIQKSDGLLVTIVSITLPLAQAIYFWGRTLTGGFMPWAPLGALPRYMCMGIMVYLLYVEVSL